MPHGISAFDGMRLGRASLWPVLNLSRLCYHFSSTLNDHLRHLASVFDRLRLQAYSWKLTSVISYRNKLCILVTFSAAKKLPDKAILTAVTTYPTPQNTEEVKQFMGISNYYRHFIPAYAYIAESLHCLLRKVLRPFSGLNSVRLPLTHLI